MPSCKNLTREERVAIGGYADRLVTNVLFCATGMDQRDQRWLWAGIVLGAIGAYAVALIALVLYAWAAGRV
jgi:hypothetical protein